MGFFSLKATCAVCGKDAGLNRYQIANKEWICSDCFKRSGYTLTTPIRKITAEEAKKAISTTEEKKAELEAFIPTKKISNLMEINEETKQWLVHTGILGGRGNTTVYKYEDIIDFELLEDGTSVSKGGIGRAVAGGLLFGGVGAIVGGATGKRNTKGICNSLKIKITVNNMSNPTVYINMITTPTKKDSFTYKTFYNAAQECLSALQLICSNVEAEHATSAAQQANSNSAADEILKFKGLLDSGIITEEQFEDKKKQLLGL
ncbi:MAG: hypothetical protein K0S75_1453 [Clostridia bacterium]|jgi:hypothetical protein|nr:hypothetical protein [Clostridia bacterium]